MLGESSSRHRIGRRRLVAAGAIALLLLALLVAIALRWATLHARSEAAAAAAQAVHTNEGLLSSELQKFRLLPVVLAEYPDVREALVASAGGAAARLNAKLEMLASRTDAAAIYVIASDGRTMAASNWRLKTSFVGHDYGFRPYFRNAMAQGSAELFALGTVSARPGLYIARRMEANGVPIGVVVVKVEFDKLEALWARQPSISFVVDRHGVVIITGRPDWRFRTTRQLSPAQELELQKSLQFGRDRLRSLDLGPLGRDGTIVRDGGGTRYVPASAPTALDEARLISLVPLAPAVANANSNARAAILAGFALLVLIGAFLLRGLERRLLQEEARHALEREVELRTAELRDANLRLQAESREREAVAIRYRAAREDLAQANRLSSIGQIVAGVVHEINQPVAAIRTFADNAGQFLARGATEQVNCNLSTISDLTVRIGRITAELRAFARRRTAAARPVVLRDVLEGAMLLVGDFLAARGIVPERVGEETLTVIADRIRLEQILVNLLQNAGEALAGQEHPQVRVSISREGERVRIEVADNGPGIALGVQDQLFTPFVTGREDGLGLGLAIARNIARDLGGELELVPSPLGGAAFHLSLRAK